MKIYTDGGSRGNPGPSAIAFLILDEHDRVVRKYRRFLGIRTNNQAEYEALVSALKCASGLTNKSVTCLLDSEVVGNQLNGKYGVKDSELRDLYFKVKELQEKFSEISFVHVRRTNKHIQEVDQMVNEELDEAA
jgi:ribonuclease HI